MKSRRLLICFVSLFVLTQTITANDELRERFLSLRSRSNTLRRAPTLDDLNDQPTESSSHLPSESTASSIVTFEPQTTAASLRRKQISGRKPNLRLGVRSSSENTHTQEALTSEGPDKTAELPTFTEPEALQEFSSVDSRSRVRGAFGNHRFRPNTSRQTAVLVTVDNNENLDPEPKIVELPPSAVPLSRRPQFPRRVEKEIESIILTPDETLPINQNPTNATGMKKDAIVEIDANLQESQVSGNGSKLNSPLTKFEPSEPEFAMPFSFKHELRPNPIRGSFKSSETKKPFLEKKIEFKLNADETVQNKTNKISPIKNFYEAQGFVGNDGDKETLETSETRTRSKIEIKEVNGTLYEYEYIYYYDDEAPLYDYDSPAIADEPEPTDAVNQIEELTKVTPKPKATTAATTTTSTTTTTTTTTTTPSPPPPRIRQRPNSGRGRTRPSQKQETQELTQEIVAQRGSLRSPPDLQQNVIPEVDSRVRVRLTQPSRQPTRSRGNSRALVIDSAPAENIIHDVKFEEQNLPAHTRFPPRATPPTHELAKEQELSKKGLDERLDTPVVLAVTGDQDRFEISQHIQPELVTETFAHADFGDEVTTVDSASKTDASVANLYALSKVVDTDFEDATTGVPIHAFDTPSPTDYESLYDYDLTLSELEELDFITTVGYDLTTEKITTTSTTTTTTTPLPTTTTTTTEATVVPVQGRGRLGGARTRGQSITRPKGLSRGKPELDVEANTVTERIQTEVESIPATPVRPGGRPVRPDLKNRGNLRTRGQPLTAEHDANQNEMIKEKNQEPVEEVKPKAAPSRRPVSNLSRPRPGLGGRFKPKTHEEDPAKEVPTTESSKQAVTEEQTTETIKPSVIPPRTRRPSPPAPPTRGRPVSPPKSGLSRFNRVRPSTSKPETSEPEQQEQNINSTTQEPLQFSNTEESKDEEKVAITEVRQAPLPSRKSQGGKHRFNLPNKFSRTRPAKETAPNEKDSIDSKTLTLEDPANTETATSKASEDTNTSVTKATEATEQATPINRKRPQKPRDNRFKVPNGRTRTRGRGFINAESESSSPGDQGSQVISAEPGVENEAGEPKIEVTTQVVVPAGSNLRTRTKGQSRSIPNERKEKNVSKTGLSSLFRKSGLLKQNEETKESVVTEAQAVETPAEVVRNPFDALAELSGPESDGSPQTDKADVKETGSEASETAVEGEAAAVDTTEDAPGSADEKLTRRQVLASRRTQFLG